MRGRRWLAVMTLVAALLPMVSGGGAVAGSVTRVWGADRFATAVEVSKLANPNGAWRVFVATGFDYPDALTAAWASWPVLLTRKDSLPANTLAEIQRLKPSSVYVVGGPGVISDAVVTQIQNGLPGTTVQRLWGPDRFATAVAVSQAFETPPVKRVYVATGFDFPDALAAGGGWPGVILLTRKDSIPAATLAEIQRVEPGVVYVVGGTGVISDAVVTAIQNAVPGTTVQRLWGADRFATAVEVSKTLFPGPDRPMRVFVATGFDFPDALSAGGASGPVLLTRKDSLPAVTAAEIRRLQPAEVVVIGGTGVVSDAVLTQIQDAFVTGTDDPAQRAALVALYNATDGPNWTNRQGWLSSASYCTWYGVGCGPGNVVRTLTLRDNGLAGSLPTELGNLTGLEAVDLWKNQLTGSIPASLASWTNLRFLSLSTNQLSGSIPTWLGTLSNLELLGLSGNQFTGSIPTELGNLSKLTFLSLSHNQLSGSIPTQLGNLTALEGMDLSWNQLSGPIPASLGSLPNLQHLWLLGNQLSGGIPTELGNLSNLTILFLNWNQLTGSIPASFGNLSKLRILHLENNQLGGAVPVELMNLDGTLATFQLHGQTGCLTASPTLAAWLAGFDPNWNDGC